MGTRSDALHNACWQVRTDFGNQAQKFNSLFFRYPFHGAEHSGLFAKIRRGQFSLPDSLSSRAKCLIKCLLRKEPSERITTEDVLVHPWLVGSHRERGAHRRSPNMENSDQAVPVFSDEASVAVTPPSSLGHAALTDILRPVSELNHQR